LARAAEPDVQAAVEAVDGAICGDFFDRGCVRDDSPCGQDSFPTAMQLWPMLQWNPR
jgi:hypothetical protein